MSDIHFSKNYQLESIRADLAKVIGAVNSLLPPKPLSPVPSTAGHYFGGPLGEAMPAPVETYDGGKRGIAQKPRPVAPIPVATKPDVLVEVPFSSLENSRIAKYQQEILELVRDHRAVVAAASATLTQWQVRYGDAKTAQRHLARELHDLSRKHDIALLKLKDIHALSGITGDPHLTSKLNPVEFP